MTDWFSREDAEAITKAEKRVQELFSKQIEPRESLAEARARFRKECPVEAKALAMLETTCMSIEQTMNRAIAVQCWCAWLKGAGFNGDEPCVEGK